MLDYFELAVYGKLNLKQHLHTSFVSVHKYGFFHMFFLYKLALFHVCNSARNFYTAVYSPCGKTEFI